MLLGLAPFAAFLNDNRLDAEVDQVIPWAAAALTPAVAVVLIVWRLKGARTAAMLGPALGGFIFMFFNFHPFAPRFLDPASAWVTAVVLWALATAAIAGGLALLSRRQSSVTVIAVIAAAFFVVPAGNYAFSQLRSNDRGTTAPPLALGDLPERPDVYFFLVDAYARADVLEKEYGYDDRHFLGALRARGFEIATRARSNYMLTNLSLPSILDMRYLDGGRRVDKITADKFEPQMRDQSRTVATFRRLGYRYVQAPGGWNGILCGASEDLCIKPHQVGGWIGFDEAGWAIFRSTPLQATLKAFPVGGIDTSLPDKVVRALKRAKVKRPFFLFSHILTAHPPWPVRGPSCKSIGRLASLSDGGDERSGYVAGVECTNVRLLKAIDAIRADDPSAVVVLQADHGSRPGLDWSEPRWKWPRVWVEQRSSPLSALLLPRRCRHDVPDALAAVNTMRVVFSCLSGRRLRMLPMRMFAADPGLTQLREWLPPNGRPLPANGVR